MPRDRTARVLERLMRIARRIRRLSITADDGASESGESNPATTSAENLALNLALTQTPPVLPASQAERADPYLPQAVMLERLHRLAAERRRRRQEAGEAALQPADQVEIYSPHLPAVIAPNVRHEMALRHAWLNEDNRLATMPLPSMMRVTVEAEAAFFEDDGLEENILRSQAELEADSAEVANPVLVEVRAGAVDHGAEDLDWERFWNSLRNRRLRAPSQSILGRFPGGANYTPDHQPNPRSSAQSIPQPDPQPDPQPIQVTRQILESFARSSHLNPMGRPWFSLQLIGEAIHYLRALQQERLEEERRVDALMAHLHLLNCFSDSRLAQAYI
jgi:hypothetical protein